LANTYFYNGFGFPTKTFHFAVATAIEETMHSLEKPQQSLEDATSEMQKSPSSHMGAPNQHKRMELGDYHNLLQELRTDDSRFVKVFDRFSLHCLPRVLYA